MDIRIEQLMDEAISKGASDIHFSTGGLPAYRLDGNICFFEAEPLANDEIERFLSKHLSRNSLFF